MTEFLLSFASMSEVLYSLDESSVMAQLTGSLATPRELAQ